MVNTATGCGFTPNKEGIYTYTCWMNMIKVIDDVDYFKEE
jgi:plastocyanin domain-containing protein